MPEDEVRSRKLRAYVEATLKELNLDPRKYGELLLFGEAIRQFADEELGADGLRSLIIHTQNAFMSDVPEQVVKGIYDIYSVDRSIVDRLLDVNDSLDVDVGTTDYSRY